MKILHILNNLEFGGTEKLIVELSNVMSSKGEEVSILTFSEGASILKRVQLNSKINFITMKTSRFNPLIPKKIQRFLNNSEYDIIHVHLFPALYWMAFVKKRHPWLKMVFTEHSTYNRRMKIPILKPFERSIYLSYDKIIAISPSVKESLVKWLGRAFSDKIKVIYNGIDTKSFSKKDCNDFYSIKNKQTIKIVMVASFNHYKDQFTLVKSIPYVPENIEVILLGDGKRLKQVQKLVRALNLTERVRFLGYRRDVPLILNEADIYVHSVKYEGFGLSVVEAMSTGLPIVASDINSLRDVLGKCGEYFPVGDYQKLSEIIRRLVNSGSKLASMCKCSIERSLMFDINRTADEHLKTYREVLNS